MERRNTVGRGMANGRRRRRQCCLIGAAFFAAGSGGGNSAVCAFGYVGVLSQQQSSSRSLRPAGGGRGGIRRPRVPSSPAQEKALFATARRRNAFVVEGGGANPVTSSSTADWRDLTKEEETALCELIVENRRIQDLQVELERKESRPVTVQEWAVAAGHPSAHQLMAALQEGRKAQRTLALCHQGLVRSVAYRYKQVSRNLSLDDLTQEGNVGLLQAVEKFDPTKGTRFSSYAVFRIKASVLRAIADKDRLVRVPVHAQDAAMRILAASHALQLESGGDVPTDAQLAVALGMPEASVALYRKSLLPQNIADLDNSALSGSPQGRAAGGGSRGGRVGGEQWPWEASQLAQAYVVRRDMMRAMQACLSPTEERALRLRFGLGGAEKEGAAGGGGGALTFKEIGRTMELSAEGIRKMVFRSIAKLQASDEANGLLLAYADLI
ncbi:unnamed protein product [Ectocarpus sp. CCAP 1310/34]|nr:unnamed protein product [Ectocarpus sp. CCAP 1310/34]